MVWRTGVGYIENRMVRIELPEKRKSGGPERRFMDVVGVDIRMAGVTKEEAEDRRRWK